MNIIFKNLPSDIFIKILEYYPIIKYRNRKFVNQISKDDNRYKILENISSITPIFFTNYSKIPMYYSRELGKYLVKLQIDETDESYESDNIFRYIFQRKREENDTSQIILYFHELI